MPGQELLLVGDRYFGRFLANRGARDFEAGSGYTECLEARYWWAGVGSIKDNKDGATHRFLFTTLPERDGKETDLYDAVVTFTPRGYSTEKKPTIINRPRVIDLILGQIFNDAIRREEIDIVPTVYPGSLKLEELVALGLVAEDSGQIRLSLG